ncbi:MAG: hypothetical protein HQK52_15895 [Oligoflexia bacterium]|nr:hypothetical protein [Oligoflexia bacterium]
MFRIIFIFIGFIGITSSFANSENCANLSFKSLVGAGTVEWHQIGCEKYHLTFLDPEGNAYAESDTIFSSDFHNAIVDDQYEKYTSLQRWMWSRDRQTLIHEAVIDSLDKNTLEKKFTSISELIILTPDKKIQRAMNQLIRVEKSDGKVTVEQKSKTEHFDRL